MSETKQEFLAEEFEQYRQHLLSVAFRMLGSLSDAEDAVQETWLRLSRSDIEDVQNPGGWLTTVVSRVCLDALRSRKSRREDSLESLEFDVAPVVGPRHRVNAAQEAEMADSVGLAMLVVLDRLNAAERVAFVLHDMFDVSFDDIASIIGKSQAATRQLASRARRRLIGAEPPDTARSLRQEVIDAYLAASRRGDFEALMALLDPEVEFQADAAAVLAGAASSMRGAETIAAVALKYRARVARAVLVNGEPGIVVAPLGRLQMVMIPTLKDGKIVCVKAVGDPVRLAELNLAVPAIPQPV